MSKDVVLTDHAQEKEIPEFEIRNILEKSQGKLFHDRKHDSRARVKKGTVVVFSEKQNKKVVITAYRKNSPTKFSNSRFKQIRSIEM